MRMKYNVLVHRYKKLAPTISAVPKINKQKNIQALFPSFVFVTSLRNMIYN